MPTPAQQGVQVLVKVSPNFANFEVVDKTWQEKDALDHSVLKGGASTSVNVTFWDPGVDAQADLVPHAGVTPCKKGDVLPEAAPSTQKWLVVDLDNKNFGGDKFTQSVKLMRRDSLALT